MERFICDEMLGTLAKWLRILGFDTEYAKGMDDTAILDKAGNEGRILLTRDRELHERAIKRKISAMYLSNADLKEDLGEVLKEHRPDPDLFMSRCTVCNTPIEEIEKEDAGGKVPDGVYERQERFWRCPKCGRYYWEGSHWENMREFLRPLVSLKL